MGDRKNGQQLAAENIDSFRAWVEERELAKDWSDYVRRGVLNRSEIAAECGFDRKVFGTNPVVKALLAEVEKCHITPSKAEGSDEPDGVSIESDGEADVIFAQRAFAAKAKLEARVKSLEERNATLLAEITDLRQKLSQYSHIDEHLAETGRLLAR